MEVAAIEMAVGWKLAVKKGKEKVSQAEERSAWLVTVNEVDWVLEVEEAATLGAVVGLELAVTAWEEKAREAASGLAWVVSVMEGLARKMAAMEAAEVWMLEVAEVAEMGAVAG